MLCDILIIGTGSLARATVYALSAVSATPLRICIVGRDMQEAASIAAIANARTRCFESMCVFYADQVIWQDEYVEQLLDTHMPKVVFHTSSLQSAWELQGGASDWCRLVNKAGYACTIALQASLASMVLGIIKKRAMPIAFINACYPDAVNALLSALELPVLAGIGNIAILHKSLAKAHNIKMLAHHFHLTKSIEALISDSQCFRAWDDECELQPNPNFLTPVLAAKGSELNQITGAIAAELLRDLFSDTPSLHHLPGPLGLQGGYPVRVCKGSVELALPLAISSSQAIAQNLQWAALDGVTIEKSGFVKFSPQVATILSQSGNLYADGFYADKLDEVCEYFKGVKHRLK